MIHKSSTILNFLLLEPILGKLRNNINLEKDYSVFKSLIDGGLTSEETLSEPRLKQPSATGQENYQHLSSVGQQVNMCTSKHLLRCYNSKDIVPTVETLKKLVDFYGNKGIGLLNPGCICQILKFICLHKSISAKSYPFTESDNDLLERKR